MRNNAKKAKSAIPVITPIAQQQSSTNNNWLSPSDNSGMRVCC